MSAIAAARTAFVAQVAAGLPTVQVLPVPPAENEALKESVFVTKAETRFEFRTIGPRRSNRREDVTLTVRVEVYREGPTQTGAALAAVARADELCEAIENAVADGLDLGGTVTHALVSGWTVTPVPRPDGWSATADLTVEAMNLPPC